MLIGVTGDALLKKKKFAHVLEPFDKRCRNVREFFSRLSEPSLMVDIFELVDPAGRAATDEELQACILTRETEKGGVFINNKRAENGLNALTPVFVDIVDIK